MNTSPETPKTTLAQKLVAVMKAVDFVEKSGKNEKQGYKYVKATDVAREIRKALIEQGVSFGYQVDDTIHWTHETNNGGKMYFIQLNGTVTFTDAASGESVSYKGLGWGMDSGDKAPYKAMTGLLKYALRMVFMIPDESDPENDTAEGNAPATIQRKSEKVQIGINGDEPVFEDDDPPVIQRAPATPKTGNQCPKCHASAIIKSKPEYGGGFVCFKGKGGCGAKFPEGQFA